MTVTFVVSRAAADDLEAILIFLAREGGPSVAAKYRREFFRLFMLLRDQPALGARRPKLGEDVRVGVVAPYLALYRHARHTVTYCAFFTAVEGSPRPC